MAEMKQATPRPSPIRRFWLTLSILVIVTAGVFQGVLGHQLLWYDDEIYVLKNPLIYPFDLITMMKLFVRTYFRSYTPLTHLSHAIDFDLWGAAPFGHHLTNYLLHLCNTAVIFVLTAGMICFVKIRPRDGVQQPWRFLMANLTPSMVLGAFFGAAFFSLHPLRVESVAWVSDRKDLLMTFFTLMSFLGYLMYRMDSGGPGGRRWYWISVASAVLAMLAKTVALMIPLVLLLADFTVFDLTGRQWWRLVREKIPYLAGSAVVGAGALLALSRILPHPPIFERTWPEMILAPFYTWAIYFWKTCVPIGLTPLYGIPDLVSLLLGLLLVGGLTAFVVVVARRGRRIPLFVWGSFVLFLLPTILGRGPAGIQPWADRYSYLPCVGFAVLFGGEAAWLWERLRGTVRLVAGGAFLLVIAGLVILAYVQIPFWKDDISLFTLAVERNPRLIMAHTNLGNALTRAGRPAEAVAELKQAIAINDRFYGAYQYLGLAYQAEGDHRKAREVFKKAIALDSNFVEAHSNLGNTFYALGEYDSALMQYRESIRKDPDFPDAYYNMGVVTYAKGDTLAAMAMFRKAAEINPNSADTYVSMGIVYSDRGMEDSAYVEYARAAALGHREAMQLVRSRRR